MAISAQRFKSIGTDFNVAVADFKSVVASEIQNSPLKDFKNLLSQGKDLVNQIKEKNQEVQTIVKGAISDVKTTVDDFTGEIKSTFSEIDSTINGIVADVKGEFDEIKSGINDIKEIYSGVKNAIEDATRFTDSVFDSFTELGKMSEETVVSLIDETFGDSDSTTKNLIKNMTKVCRNRALGNSVGFKNNFKTPKCNGINVSTKTNCSQNTATDIINQATTAELEKTQQALNKVLSQVLTLANVGFGANLCGVFSAVTQGVTDQSVISTAAGVLINQQAKQGNLQAVFDISKNLEGSNITGSFPKTLSNIAENVKTPTEINQQSLSNLSDRITGSFELINENWNKSSDGILTICGLGTPSKNLASIFSSKITDKTLDVRDLESPVGSTDDSVLIAYSARQSALA